jgi:hypothetical protein
MPLEIKEVGMSRFMGGSASAMARQIADGFTLVTAVTLKRLQVPELDTLLFELDKRLRDLRGTVVDLEDLKGIQKRNRTMSRVENACRVIRGAKQQRTRRGG